MKVSNDIGLARALFQQEQARNEQTTARAEEALARDKGGAKPPVQDVREGADAVQKKQEAKSFSREAPRGQAQKSFSPPGSQLNILV